MAKLIQTVRQIRAIKPAKVSSVAAYLSTLMFFYLAQVWLYGSVILAEYRPFNISEIRLLKPCDNDESVRTSDNLTMAVTAYL